MNRAGLFLLLAAGAWGQTCNHQVTRSPIGPVLVYSNGVLLKQGADFLYTTAAGKMPTISPVNYRAGDEMTVVFSRQVPLSTSLAGASISYVGYQNWSETWICASGSSGPRLPWVPQSCTFATPPAAPVDGQTCVFLDADLFKSCQGAAAGSPSGWETCRWSQSAGLWKSTAVPVESPLFPFTASTSRAIECTGGLVPVSAITPGTQSVEYPLFQVDGSVRWEHVLVAEQDKFLPDIGLEVAMGRPGPDTNSELTGAYVKLGQASALSTPWISRPNPPQLSGAYAVVLNFRMADGHLLQELAAGSLYWEACGYRVGPLGGPAPARLAGLASCSGSGTSTDPATGKVTGWDCAGLWKASILLPDGSPLPLVGVKMESTGGVWTAR